MESWAHLFTSKKDKFISCESTIAAEFRKRLSLLSGLKAFFCRYIRIFVTFAVHCIYIANKQTNKQASKKTNKNEKKRLSSTYGGFTFEESFPLEI